jgi:hypothetical protein
MVLEAWGWVVWGLCVEEGGDGADTFCWTEPWLGEIPVCEILTFIRSSGE